MKNMKVIFVAAALLLAVAAGVIMNSVKALTILADDGYAVPANSGVSRMLSSGDAPAVVLVGVEYDDVVYTSLGGYLVGDDRRSIDRSFPLYVNNGTGLRFLDEETWLVSAQIDLLRTYDGLYMTDGYTYNSDLTQADSEEFILLALQNKLYMNAQPAVFENRIRSHNIPSNSILAMTDSGIRWYYLDHNALVYAEEKSVFDAKITIGDHTYDYARFLKALGLLQDTIRLADKGQNIDDAAAEIEDILNGEEEQTPAGAASGAGTGAGSGLAGEALPAAGNMAFAGAVPGAGELLEAAGEEGEEGDAEAGAEGEEGDAEDGENGEEAGEEDVTGEEGEGEGEEAGEAGDKKGSSGKGGDKNSGGTGNKVTGAAGNKNSGSAAGGAGSGNAGTPAGQQPGSGPSAPGSSGSNTGLPLAPEQGSEGSGSGAGGAAAPGSGGDEQSGDTGSGGEGEAGDEAGGGSAENPNPQPGTPNPDGSDHRGPSTPMKYKDPVVTLKNLDAWTYALGADLDIDDPYGAIQRGVKVAVYSRLQGDLKSIQPDKDHPAMYDVNNNQLTMYSKDKNEGKSSLVRRTFVGDQTIAMSTIPPNTTIYVQYYYRYNREVERVENKDENGNWDGTYTMTFERKTFYSDFYELKTPSIDGNVKAVQASWDINFASQENAMELDDFTIANTSNYDPTKVGDDLDFNNFKLDSLPYIYRMEYTLIPVGEDGQPIEGAEEIVLTAGSSVMNKAKAADGTVYLSSTPKLDSNTHYQVTVKGLDRWSNELPLKIVGEDGELVDSSTPWIGHVFTRKATPTVTIEEVENVTDKLTVRITVNDPDGALAKDEGGHTLPLKLTAADSQGVLAAIYGHWVKIGETAPTAGFGTETDSELALEDPANGKVYELTLESLAFAQLYTLQVSGSYDPQPTAPGADETGKKLARVEDMPLGTLRCYTASLTSGSVNFTSSVVNLLDTSGTVQMTMNSRSTLDVLPLVDEFRFHLSEKKTGQEVNKTVVLKMTDFDVSDSEKYPYDSVTSRVILSEGGYYEDGTPKPTVYLSGTEAAYKQANCNPWQAMLRRTGTRDDGTQEELPVMTLCIDYPKDTMHTSTTHTMRMESVVIKSGIEYQIPTSLTVTEFTTRKIQPTLDYEDLFIAGDVMEYINIRILDPDGTINSDNGLVYVYLCYLGDATEGEGTTLQALTLNAGVNPDPTNLRFEGLIPGANYVLRFVAKSFNDADGYTNQKYNWRLWEYPFKGGSFLTGSLNLVGLDRDGREGMTDDLIKYRYTITGEKLQEELQRTKDDNVTTTSEWTGTTLDHWVPVDSDRYMSPLIPINSGSGEKITFLQLDGYNPTTWKDASVYFRFYKDTVDTKKREDGSWGNIGGTDRAYETSWASDYYSVTTVGATPVVAVPDDARYYRVLINGREFAQANGFTVLGYAQEKNKNYFVTYKDHEATLQVNKYTGVIDGTLSDSNGMNVVYMMRVQPGEIYTGQWYDNGYFYLYAEDKSYMGRIQVRYLSLFRVPEGVHYISFAYNNTADTQPHYMYRLSAVPSDDYAADVEVRAEDVQGYLYSVNTPFVTLRLYQSKSIQLPSFGEEPIMEQKVDLVPLDAEVRADPTKWASYKGSWVPDEKDGDPDGIVRLLQEQLEPDSMYRLTLSAQYKESLVVLDTIEFQTDGIYDTISCNEEMRKILRNPYGNFLVVADFDHYLDPGTDITLYGTLDFQGHVITRRKDASATRPYLIYENRGVIRNLVYDYPNDTNYTSTSAVVYQNMAAGVMENIIVRTQGTVHVTKAEAALLLVNNYGRVHNFIVKLGGDLRIHGNTQNLGGIFYNHRGTIEDGYVYSDNTHGVLLYPNANYIYAPYYGGLIRWTDTDAVTRHVYTAYDTWFAQPDNMTNYSHALIGNNDSNGSFTDSYHVGEFYVYSGYADGAEKTYNTRVSTAIRLTNARRYDMNRNITYFTDNRYEPQGGNARYIYHQLIKGLRDTDWQAKTLGSGFDAAECVSMGFYPRLNSLSNEMQKFQEYIPLPTQVEGQVPVLLSDDWATGEDYGEPEDEHGFVRFVFQNDQGCEIKSLTASTGTGTNKKDTLKIEIRDQGRTDDGLWYVIAEVTPEEYLSYYTITDMTYERSGSIVTSTPNYSTQNIEFWKDIRTATDWQDISNNGAAGMTWNYRVVQNINFEDVGTPQFMTVDGNGSDYGTRSFSGKIDGMDKDGVVHTLSNITMKNVSRPWVFYDVTNGGTVRNLIVDHLTITTSNDIPSDRARTGFFRTLNSATIENVHVTNSTLEGAGYIGGLAAYESASTITGCSVSDTQVTDRGSSAAVSIGGLIGWTTWYSTIRSCYVRDVTVTAMTSPVIQYAGGVVGYDSNCALMDVYATGSVTAKANYVGGLAGYTVEAGSRTKNTWANVKLDSYHADGRVGGLVGHVASATNDNGLALGNILSVTEDTTHRAIGSAGNTTLLATQQIYAYADQTVNSASKEDSYQVRRLLSAEQLHDKSIWTETVRLGSQWDYRPVTEGRGYFPKLLDPADPSKLLYGQEDIPLPSQNNYELVVLGASYSGTSDNRTMTVECKLVHPGVDTRKYEVQGDQDATNKAMNEQFKVTIDGMDMSDEAFKNGDAVINWSPDLGETSFNVNTKKLTKALDYYRMTVTLADGTQLNAQIWYGEPFYWDVPNLARWNELMSGNPGHGKTNENFRITGMIDFGGAGTEYTGLRLGRLEGPDSLRWKAGDYDKINEKGETVTGEDGAPVKEHKDAVTGGGAYGDGVGFKNLVYTAGPDGQPWIECVDHEITRLYFQNITGHFNDTGYQRERTGMVMLCSGLSDLVFEDIALTTVRYSNYDFGFVSRVEGNMERVRVGQLVSDEVNGGKKGAHGLRMERAYITTNDNSYSDYAGGVAARITGVMTEIKGYGIEVKMLSNYLGGIVGGTGSNDGVNNYTHMLDGDFKDITIENGGYRTGGVVGTTGAINIDGLRLERVNVHVSRESSQNLGGVFAGLTYPYNFQQDILVTNCGAYDERPDGYMNSQGESGVGGYAGYLYSRAEPVRRIRIENTKVQSRYTAGGIASISHGSIRDAEIYNCEITSAQSDSTKKPNYSMYTGGAIGYYNQDATSVHLAGIVVRDTTITGRSAVGGIIGYSNTSGVPQLENCFVAEDVVIRANGLQPENTTDTSVLTPFSAAGGLIGMTRGSFTIQDCIVGADISAVGQGAGGFIGYAETSGDGTVTRTRKLTTSIAACQQIRADGGYAGGLIGLLGSAIKVMPDDSVTGVIAASNVLGGGAKNSLWINDMATISGTSHDFPGIYIWDKATVNGQLAQDIADMAEKTGADGSAAKPASGMLVAAENFKLASFYSDAETGLGFTPASTSLDIATAIAERGNWELQDMKQADDEADKEVKYFPFPAFNNWDNTSATTVVGQGARKSNQVLELAHWKETPEFGKPGTVATGIPLPVPGENTTQTAVYASGINTVNVETAEPNQTVTLGGVELTTDEHGVATMTYDFKTDLTLGEVPYKAEDLRRDTLVNNAYWYFIDDFEKQPENNPGAKGQLRCGEYIPAITGTSNTTDFVKISGTPDTLSNVVHLWGHQALTSDGKIYTLSGNTATLSGTIAANAAMDTPQPFYDYTTSTGTAVKVFHNFTLYGDVVLNQRLYPLNSSIYTVSPYKPYVYDGVLLHSSTSGDVTNNYFAVLDKAGNLTSYLSAINCTSWDPKGIKQMSNTFNTSTPLVVLRYESGRVCVVNFGSDRLIYDSSQAIKTTLLEYAGDYLTSLFHTAGPTRVPQDPTYRDALDQAQNYRDPFEVPNPSEDELLDGYMGGGDTALPGGTLPDGTLPGSGEGADESMYPAWNGQGMAPDADPNAPFTNADGGLYAAGGTVQGGVPGASGAPGLTAEYDPAAAAAPSGAGGTAAQGGVTGIAGEPGETTGDTGLAGTDPSAAANAGTVDGPGGAEGDGQGNGDTAAQTTGEAAASGGVSGTQAAAGAAAEDLPETLYLRTEDSTLYKAVSGKLAPVAAGAVSYDAKNGTVTLNGQTYYVDRTFKAPASLPGVIKLLSAQRHASQQMAELGAAVVAYDPVTGKYSPYVTQTLLDDDPRKTTDPVPGTPVRETEAEEEILETAGESDFEVGHGLGRDLTAREQSGFILLYLAAGGAFVILGVIFIREKRRRR